MTVLFSNYFLDQKLQGPEGKKKWKEKPEGGETSLQLRIDFLKKIFVLLMLKKKFISITTPLDNQDSVAHTAEYL